jgi:hypothetical protein
MTLSFSTSVTKAGETLEIAGRASKADIPANWQKTAVLERAIDHSGQGYGERFLFFKTPKGLVAEVMWHPMNGGDDLFIRLGSREFMASRFKELLEGEPYETRTSTYGGGIDRRSGRMAKAHRIA